MLLFFAFGLLLASPAKAEVYDNFNAAGIDTGKWKVSGASGLFSQPGDGRLYFGPGVFTPATGTAKLVSSQTFGPHFFTVEFHDFNSTNLQPPGSQQGAFLALGLTDGTNFVRIMRNQNGVNGKPFGVIEVNYNIGSSLQVHYVATAVTGGKLGLNYDGQKVTFWYDVGTGWQHTGWKTAGQSGIWTGEWAPNWGSQPCLYLQGYDLYGHTRFSLDNAILLPAGTPWRVHFPLLPSARFLDAGPGRLL